MKQFARKLKSKAGETLVEALVSILIFTMASIAMYSMVTAAGDINGRAKETDRLTQEQLVIAEQGEGSGTSGSVTMTLIKADGSTAASTTVAVSVYGSTDGLYAYYKVPEGE